MKLVKIPTHFNKTYIFITINCNYLLRISTVRLLWPQYLKMWSWYLESGWVGSVGHQDAQIIIISIMY